jgi:hypothetical protein
MNLQCSCSKFCIITDVKGAQGNADVGVSHVVTRVGLRFALPISWSYREIVVFRKNKIEFVVAATIISSLLSASSAVLYSDHCLGAAPGKKGGRLTTHRSV